MNPTRPAGVVTSAAAVATAAAVSLVAVLALPRAAVSEPAKAGAEAAFAPAAPARVLLERARDLHKKTLTELDGDAEHAGKMAMLLAEWLHVQEYRDDKALSDWAGKLAKLYAQAGEAAAEDKDKAGAALKGAGKLWADYEKNAKTWNTAKPKPAPAFKRMGKEIAYIMAFHKQANEIAEKAVKGQDISKVGDELLLLAEMGNIIARDRPAADWKKFSVGLRDAALELIKVGEKNDPIALKPALLEVQKNCNSCHGNFRGK